MIGIDWLVLLLALSIPAAFVFGRKVERVLLTRETLRQIKALKKKHDQDLTRAY